ncbi:MAG: hypothetical protein EOO70_09060, partial [Myxococcaceae bacterium]
MAGMGLMNRCLLLLSGLLSVGAPAMAGIPAPECRPVSTLKDIAPGAEGSDPAPGVTVGGALFFAADDGAGGAELWKTDGTAAGTLRVKDIRPGPEGASPAQLTAVGDTLFFIADNGANGLELWKSDGTEAGTTLVKDLVPGGGSSLPT